MYQRNISNTTLDTGNNNVPGRGLCWTGNTGGCCKTPPDRQSPRYSGCTSPSLCSPAACHTYRGQVHVIIQVSRLSSLSQQHKIHVIPIEYRYMLLYTGIKDRLSLTTTQDTCHTYRVQVHVIIHKSKLHSLSDITMWQLSIGKSCVPLLPVLHYDPPPHHVTVIYW